MKKPSFEDWMRKRLAIPSVYAKKRKWGDDPMEGTCLSCKKRFRKSHSVQKYCSPDCSYEGRKKK